MHPSRIILLGAFLFLASPCWAAPPAVTNLTPRGAERGKAVEIVVTGTNLTGQPRLAAPFPIQQKVLPDAKPNPAQVRIQITLDAAVPLGIYPVRLLTDEGISNLVMFGVDAFPNLVETEDNNTPAKAQKVPFPVIITGQCAGGDVDHYRFAVTKGQRVVVETEAARLGSGVVPQVRVTDGQARFVAGDAAGKVRGDCRLWFTAPADGDYVVEFSDSRYRGGNPPYYRLKIADYDFADEVFPLGARQGEKGRFQFFGGTFESGQTFQAAQLLGPAPKDWFNTRMRLVDPAAITGPRPVKPGMTTPLVAMGEYPEITAQPGKDLQILAPPLTINGRFAIRGERHRFQMPVQPGQRWRFTVEAESLGSYLDGVLRLTNPAGAQLALVDDVDVPPQPGQQATKAADPSLEFTVPAGLNTLHIELRDGLERGGVNFGYRLTVEPASGDFTLQQTAGEINIPRGGVAALTVPVTRRGYTGPVQLHVSGLAKGYEVHGGFVPPGSTVGVLTLRSPAEPQSGPVYWQVEGKGLGPEKNPPHARAEHRLVLSKDGNIAASTLRLTHLAVGLTGPDPFALHSPAAVELIHGYPTSIPVTVTWAMKTTPVAVEISTLGAPPKAKPPPGAITVKPATAPAGITKTTLTVLAPANASEGRNLDLVPQAKVKINNKDVLIVGPAIAVTVKKPFTVELTGAKVIFKPGETVTVKGRLVRQAIFREAVTFKLDGLPKGAQAILPKVIPADQSDFQFDMKADVKAPAATGNLSLTCSATIAGMVYTHPAVVVPWEIPGAKK